MSRRVDRTRAKATSDKQSDSLSSRTYLTQSSLRQRIDARVFDCWRHINVALHARSAESRARSTSSDECFRWVLVRTVRLCTRQEYIMQETRSEGRHEVELERADQQFGGAVTLSNGFLFSCARHRMVFI